MKAPRVVVVAVGGANFGSLRRACERLDVPVQFSSAPAVIAAASHVILPGVGAAAPAMQALRARGLDDCLARLTQPILGICLGMQLLFEHSDEGDARGLGLLPGHVYRLPPAPSWPHMGWNTVQWQAREHPLAAGLSADDWFYFVHGYAAAPSGYSLATSEFGTAFAAVVASDHVYGCQFHPEKSAAAGRRLLSNFFAL